MYDVVFISYDEPNGEKNWRRLKSIVPTARRVHGVKGIGEAHREAAMLVSTRFFWVVDGDNWVKDTFSFDTKWDPIVHLSGDEQPVGFYRARNSVNDLEYGYGGIKLLPKEATIGLNPLGQLDITTSISSYHYYMDEVASISVINETPEQAFRAGFRESVKLTRQSIIDPDDVTLGRLDIWKTKGSDRINGDYSILGANRGHQYAIKYMSDGNEKELENINDFSHMDDLYRGIVG